MSFASGFELGLKQQELRKKYEFDKTIDEAGKSVQFEIDQERQAQRAQEMAQQNLINNARPAQPQQTPGIFQQGESLGLQGYQVGNKPIQTTVPTAPAGYGMREDDTAPSQTLLGNYGTTAAFQGEKPTTEDIRMMQKDLPRPFTGPQDKSVLDLTDVSVNKPEVSAQETAKPKILDTLDAQVTSADRAKESYDYNTRVLRKLQESGNARAALEYQSKLANSELTLAQADHMKFNTAVAITKQVGNIVGNALEEIQQPGADVNKIYFDTMNRAKKDFGYTGKIPFSLDPTENIKTLQNLQRDSLTTAEKAELGIKQAVASQKTIMDQADLAIKTEKLNLERISTGLAMTKENREQATASFNRLTENVKLQFQALNSINSVMDEDYKKALRPSYDANLKTLQQFSKSLNIPMPNIAVGTPGSMISTSTKGQPVATNVQPGAAPATVNAPANTQQVNQAFPEDVLKDAGLASEAGGYVPPTPKAIAQEKKESTAKAAKIKELQNKINALQLKTKTPSSSVAISNPIQDVINLGSRAVSAVSNSDILNPSKVGKRERDKAEQELKKLQKELDSLTKS